MPPALIEQVRAQWGVRLVQGWGMTETSPLAALSFPPKSAPVDDEASWLVKSGRVVAGLEARVVGEDGEPLDRDGRSIGELQVRGPWVTAAYHAVDAAEAFTTAGSARATPARSTSTATSSSPIGPRT